jgi:hypothetical protein
LGSNEELVKPPLPIYTDLSGYFSSPFREIIKPATLKVIHKNYLMND